MKGERSCIYFLYLSLALCGWHFVSQTNRRKSARTGGPCLSTSVCSGSYNCWRTLLVLVFVYPRLFLCTRTNALVNRFLFCSTNCTVWQMTSLMKYLCFLLTDFQSWHVALRDLAAILYTIFFLFIEPLHCHKIKTNYPDVTVCVGICPGMANVPQSAVNARKHKEKRVPTWLLGNEIGDWCCKNLSSVYWLSLRSILCD